MTVVFVVSNAGVRLGCWLHLVLLQAKTMPLGTIAKCDVNVHSCKNSLTLRKDRSWSRGGNVEMLPGQSKNSTLEAPHLIENVPCLIKHSYIKTTYIYVHVYNGCCRLLPVSAQWQRACLYWQFLNDFTKWLRFMLEYTFRWMVGGFFLGLLGLCASAGFCGPWCGWLWVYVGQCSPKLWELCCPPVQGSGLGIQPWRDCQLQSGSETHLLSQVSHCQMFGLDFHQLI